MLDRSFQSFDFSEATGLCPDVFIEISKYLTLEETIDAFSPSILPLLRQTHTKVHLVDPTDRFLQAIPDHLERRQISSVRFSAASMINGDLLSSFGTFDQLISLNLADLQLLEKIANFERFFPNLQALCLRSNCAFSLTRLDTILSRSFSTISRVQIRSNHSPAEARYDIKSLNITIKSFIFDWAYSTLPSNTFLPYGRSWVLISIAEFLEHMINVRRVRFTTCCYQIQAFLEVAVWQRMITGCVHLERVTIQLMDKGDFVREAMNIEEELCRIRPGIIFRIKRA